MVNGASHQWSMVNCYLNLLNNGNDDQLSTANDELTVVNAGYDNNSMVNNAGTIW